MANGCSPLSSVVGLPSSEPECHPSVVHELDTFFSPASIAVIGASPDHTKIRGRLLQLLLQNKFPGKVFPVNPSYSELGALTCFPSMKAIRLPVDVAIVAIPAKDVVSSLEECAAAGVRHAVIISSGFAEEGGASIGMQEEIAALSRRTGLRVCGPNAEGYYNEPGRVAATFSPAVDFKDEPLVLAGARRVGIVAQSGGIGFSLLNRGKALGLPFSHVVSSGNEADLTAADFLDFMVEDASTGVIMMFLESVRDPQRFVAAAAKAAERGKPVVVCKVGRSGAGARASQSHTASMAGWNAAYEAVFARYGFMVADDADAAVAIAAALATAPSAGGQRAGIVTVSGGGGAWAADVLSAHGFTVPELSAAVQREIRGFIPSYGSAQNPVDVTAQAVQQGGVQRAIELLEASDEVDVIVVVLSLSSDTRIPFDVERLRLLAAAQRKPILFHTYTLPSANARAKLADAGFPLFTGLAHVGLAASALAGRASFRPPKMVAVKPIDPDLVARLAARHSGGSISEHDTKLFLSGVGIAVPRERLVSRADELDAAMREVGFPLAMKIQSGDIPHKSEAGGIRLGIADAAQGRTAYAELLAEVVGRRPDAHLEGVLLAPMARRGVEIILGTVRDETFGPIVMVGLGGVATELYKDVVYRPAPLTAGDAKAMLLSLRAAPLLTGFRGSPPADVDALCDLIANVSQLAWSLRENVVELELNPVVVHPRGEGITIVDALMSRTGKTDC